MQFLGGHTPERGQNDFIIYRVPHKLGRILQGICKEPRVRSKAKELTIDLGNLTNRTHERIICVEQ